MQRSVVINMERALRGVELRRFDLENAEQVADFQMLYRRLFHWAREVTLDRDPPMPRGLHNRRADNWRVLIAIADACDRGRLAREAAIAMSREHQDEDAVVEPLTDIRRIIDRLGVDRLTGKILVAELHELEEAMWSEWRGGYGDQQPRKLSQEELAILLRRFRVFPKWLWSSGRLGAKSAKGYYRHQFEAAWRSYCAEEDGTPAQSSKIKYLRSA